MVKQALFIVSLGAFGTSVAATTECGTEEYIVGIDSSRADNANGWAIWLSDKPFFDNTATKFPSDLGSSMTGGGRLDLNKDRGRFIYSMAMNAMNMGYRVSIFDGYGTQFCDDFQYMEVQGKY
ncbi:hypothetical protein [Dyella flagellata]|uniref:Uncharacterized protein n=1 Tax=Dyella flagellata TaxID=1867833 RepID=A0ABQ5X8G7_9GAMM|nr:hypothetical protein [Dyella flagellata]GLQ87552.1 hypothetical protein GCM10007898_11180 [Dyella flagellata]